MRLTRRWSVFLFAVGVWSWVIWPTFLKNIAADDRSFTDGRPQAFFVVHLVLTLVSLVIGTAVGGLGVAGLRTAGRDEEHDRVTARPTLDGMR